MPIKGLSEQRRLPRCGKIHLGVKAKNKNGVEYPKAVDYFVVPPEVAEVYGENPRQLNILIPVEDEEIWASQYYRCYSMTRGLVCRGDGETCRRMIDTETGATANRDTKEVVWKNDLPCLGRECPAYQGKKCKEVMNLQFLLPDVPGLGVWQIDTGSINSIRNINSASELIRGICGRIRMMPLTLTMEPIEVVNPDDGKKKKVNVLNLRVNKPLQSLLADTAKPVHELLAPPPVDDEAPLDTEVVVNTPALEKDKPETVKPKKPKKEAPPEQESKLPQDSPVEPNTIADLQETMAQCNWSASDVGPHCLKTKGWDIKKYADLTEEQIEELIKDIKANPK